MVLLVVLRHPIFPSIQIAALLLTVTFLGALTSFGLIDINITTPKESGARVWLHLHHQI